MMVEYLPVSKSEKVYLLILTLLRRWRWALAWGVDWFPVIDVWLKYLHVESEEERQLTNSGMLLFYPRVLEPVQSVVRLQ